MRPGSGAAGRGSALAAPRASQRRGRQPTGPDDDADGRGLAVAAGVADLDYDELARRLLVQVVQRLAVSPVDGTEGGDLAEPAGAGPAGAGPSGAALQRTVASLEQKLATVQSKQRSLTAENAKLREQLQAAQQSLAEAEARDSAGSIAGRFDTAEVLLLERLLSPLRDQRDRREEACSLLTESAGSRVRSGPRNHWWLSRAMIMSNHVAITAGCVVTGAAAGFAGPAAR